MKRLTLTALILILIAPCLNAQKKEIAQARSYIKTGKNLDKAEQLMTDLLKNPQNRTNDKIYLTAFQAIRGQYEAINEQVFLKQKYDTASLFDTTLRMFTILERLDSVDAIPDSKGRIKLKYREKNCAFLDQYRKNLFAGGNFYVRKENYKKSLVYYQAYFDCMRQPLFETMKYGEKDKNIADVAYWTTYAGYKLNNAAVTLQYAPLALVNSKYTQNVLQYQTEAYKWNKDSANYEKTLQTGFKEFPLYPYFFARLIDLYNVTKQLDKALALCDSALAVNDTLKLFRFAKSTALLNLGRYDEAIAMSDSLLAHDDSLADAYYNAGTAYINKALMTDDKSSRDRNNAKTYLQSARKYMERYRALAPNQKDKWANALYLIYFRLNMGKQFDEMDKLLKTISN